MKTYSFYDNATGLFRAFTIHCADYDLKLNTPEGCTAVEGKHDHLCRRVDLSSRAVVFYQPPQPDADHDWNAATERWEKRADALAREARRAASLSRIQELEGRQHRRVRELLESTDPQLKTISDEIAQLRADL